MNVSLIFKIRFHFICHQIDTATVNYLFKLRTLRLSPILSQLGGFGINT